MGRHEHWGNAIARRAGIAIPKSPTVAARPREMNQTEHAYSQRLEGLRAIGAIAAWAYEADTLELANRCKYTPDFSVTMPDGSKTFHEVKGGHVWEDARIKFKVAARHFPNRFFWCRRLKDGRWSVREARK